MTTTPPQTMVKMEPPATSRDRWMYEQGRLAERDPRTHKAAPVAPAPQPAPPAIGRDYADLAERLDDLELRDEANTTMSQEAADRSTLVLDASLALLAAAPKAAPADPMDWPLPCAVTVGHGTMHKGVPLRTLVARMKVLYEMTTGTNADEVANRTPEQLAELQAVFLESLKAAQASPPEPDMRAVVEALGFDPTNHHNAAKCPYCRPAPSTQDAEDAAFEAVRKKLCKLPRYSFVIGQRSVRRVADDTGSWIEFDAAHALFDPVAVDAARAQQEGGV